MACLLVAWHGTAWDCIARHGHVLAWLEQSSTCFICFMPTRRLMRDMQSRTQQEHSEKLAASNAAIVRHAARALIRDCDTLQLMGIGQGSSGSSSGGCGSTTEGSHGQSAAESSGHGHAAGGHRISGLICFDEMQVGVLCHVRSGCARGVLEACMVAWACLCG